MLFLFLFVLPVVHSRNIWEERCNGSEVPPTAVNTTQRLTQLREQFELYNISAYIITSYDEHQSEYVAERDKRREFVSGFTGSAGTAVVTKNKAAMWTDSRYYIQAASQLDCNWELMPTGEPNTLSIASWLAENLDPCSVVSADAMTTSFQEWEQWRVDLEKKNISLLVTEKNLVDLVWGADRPDFPDGDLYELDLVHAGVTWEDKIDFLREDMKAKNTDALFLTALDEIAWTLNLRGSDIPYTPVFFSYLVIEANRTDLYLPEKKISNLVKDHLNTTRSGVRIHSYNDFWTDLEEINNRTIKIWLPSRYSYALGVSYLLHTMLPADKIMDQVSPALVRKDTKNSNEVDSMRMGHIMDGTALTVFFAQLSAAIAAGDTTWTELRAVDKLDNLRLKQPNSKGPSFATIAAVGINAALPHYEPSEATDRNITDHELFLVDSGGQYLGATTDVTRTVHFGKPRSEEIAVYTKLLMGCIDLVTTIFPEKKTMNDLEVIVRRPLYSLGMDYGHGSTHGIGAMLSVHEAFNTTYHPNFYGSQEPGYYKENDFGIRLENIVRVVPAKPVSGADNYLTFETVTLFPYDQKLIDVDLLEKSHIRWINDYHKKVQDLVGNNLKEQGYTDELKWLTEQTKPLEQLN